MNDRRYKSVNSDSSTWGGVGRWTLLVADMVELCLTRSHYSDLFFYCNNFYRDSACTPVLFITQILQHNAFRGLHDLVKHLAVVVYLVFV